MSSKIAMKVVGKINPFYVVYGLTVAAGLAMIVYVVTGVEGGILYHADTGAYVEAMKSLISGKPGYWSVPVYPMLEVLCRSFGASGFVGGLSLMIIQWTVFVFAVYSFSGICRNLVGSKKICVAATAIFGLSPCILIYNCIELAESLSISCMVFLIQSALCFMRKPSVKAALMGSFLVMVMIFMKPVFIYLLPVMLSFYCRAVFRNKMFWKGAVVAIAGLGLVSGAVCGYVEWMHRTYGFRLLTYANIWNNYHFVREAGILDADEAQNQGIKDLLRQWPTYKSSATQNECALIVKRVGEDALCTEISRSVKHHPDKALKAVADRTVRFASYRVEPLICGKFNEKVSEMMPIRLWIVYLTMGCGIFLAVFNMVSLQRKHSLMLLVAIVGFHFFVVIVGSMWDWGRLMSPVYSCVVLLGAMEVEMLLRMILRFKIKYKQIIL